MTYRLRTIHFFGPSQSSVIVRSIPFRNFTLESIDQPSIGFLVSSMDVLGKGIRLAIVSFISSICSQPLDARLRRLMWDNIGAVWTSRESNEWQGQTGVLPP